MATADRQVTNPPSNEVMLVTSGDLRLSANKACWPAQRNMEEILTAAFAQKGYKLVRAHAYDEKLEHGFISSQRQGMDVFMKIHPGARLVFATAAWQYSHHVLPGLRSHQGPILTVANWSGQWPGLVGLLNLNGSLVKAGKPFSSIWSKDFTDAYFQNALDQWLRDGSITHDLSHVHPLDKSKLPAASAQLGAQLAKDLKHRKAIMGVFDEGCMGMYNAIIDDELLNPAGIFKERLSQSALVAKMRTVSDAEAQAVYQWLVAKGVKFSFGKDASTELTLDQVLDQCRMYVAAVRIAQEFGCDAIGIQYQQGLKDLVPASDLVEGMLNNSDRPPVFAEGTDTSFTLVGRCRTSMKSTNAPESMRWSPIYAGRRLDSIPLPRCTMCAGVSTTKASPALEMAALPSKISTPSSGYCKSPALLRPIILLMAMRAQSASASPPCISRSAEARSKASGNPARLFGAVFLSRVARCTPTLAAARLSACPLLKPNAAGAKPLCSGPSSTRFCMASARIK